MALKLVLSLSYGKARTKELPVERLDLTHHVTYAKHGKPVSLPSG
jgi:hypothetical protein